MSFPVLSSMDSSKPFTLLTEISTKLNFIKITETNLNNNYILITLIDIVDRSENFLYNTQGRVIVTSNDKIEGIKLDNSQLATKELSVDPYYYYVSISLNDVKDQEFKFNEEIDIKKLIKTVSGNIWTINVESVNPDITIESKTFFGKVDITDKNIRIDTDRITAQFNNSVIYYNKDNKSYETLNIMTGDVTKLSKTIAHQCQYFQRVNSKIVCITESENNTTKILELDSSVEYTIDKSFPGQIELVSVETDNIVFRYRLNCTLMLFKNDDPLAVIKPQSTIEYMETVEIGNDKHFVLLDTNNREINILNITGTEYKLREGVEFGDAEFVEEFKCIANDKKINCFVKTMYNLFRITLDPQNESHPLETKTYNNEDSINVKWETSNYHIVDSERFIRVVMNKDAKSFSYMLYSDDYSYSGVKELSLDAEMNLFIYSYIQLDILYMATNSKDSSGIKLHTVTILKDNNLIKLTGKETDEVDLRFTVHMLFGSESHTETIKLRTNGKSPVNDDKMKWYWKLLIVVGILIALVIIVYVAYTMYTKQLNKKNKQIKIEFVKTTKNK